jgi:hypothetical protein
MQEFLIGWGSFEGSVKGLVNGDKTFVVVHDYTSKNLWDDLWPTVSELMLRPNREFLCIHEPLANNGKIYMKAGVPCIRYEQLPAIFCLEHGKDVGLCILNATSDQAIEFIRANL